MLATFASNDLNGNRVRQESIKITSPLHGRKENFSDTKPAGIFSDLRDD
jgi:hypothetical protein